MAGQPCPDVAPTGCHQTTLATFILTFSDGSITAPVRLEETYIPNGVVQQSHGQITGGTGAYADLAGASVQHVGVVDFTTGPRLTFIVFID